MSDWRNNRVSGASESSEQYQEMPTYADEGWSSPPEWDEPTERPLPPPGPLIPISSLGVWLKQGIETFKSAPGEFIVVQLIVTGLISLSFGLLTGPVLAGYFRFTLQRLAGRKLDVNDLFGALSDHFMPTFLAGLGLFAFAGAGTLILLVLDLIANTLPIYALAVMARALVDLMGTLALCAVAGLFSLMLPMIHERDISLQEAFKTCLGMFQRNWLYAALFGIVVVGIPMIGLSLIVGILFAGPLGMLVAAQAFRALYPLTPKEGPQERTA